MTLINNNNTHLLNATVWLLCLLSLVFVGRVESRESDYNCSVATERVDCDQHGDCVASGFLDGKFLCDCNNGYTTFYKNDKQKDYPACNYKQKKQLVAFLLSLFVGGVGAGRWYVEDYVLAPTKMACVIGSIIIGCICICCAGACGIASESESGMFAGGAVAGIYFCCVGCGIFAWWLTDVILFATDQIKDGNGAPLDAW